MYRETGFIHRKCGACAPSNNVIQTRRQGSVVHAPPSNNVIQTRRQGSVVHVSPNVVD